MNNKIILAMMLFAMFLIGLQTAQPAAAATKIDQFTIYHMNGQSSDADVYKVYRYSLNHLYITYTGYNWNSKTHKYIKTDFHSWIDLKKITKTKVRTKEPQIDGGYFYTYKYTTHSATYYYWNTLKYKIKHGLAF